MQYRAWSFYCLFYTCLLRLALFSVSGFKYEVILILIFLVHWRHDHSPGMFDLLVVSLLRRLLRRMAFFGAGQGMTLARTIHRCRITAGTVDLRRQLQLKIHVHAARWWIPECLPLSTSSFDRILQSRQSEKDPKVPKSLTKEANGVRNRLWALCGSNGATCGREYVNQYKDGRVPNGLISHATSLGEWAAVGHNGGGRGASSITILWIMMLMIGSCRFDGRLSTETYRIFGGYWWWYHSLRGFCWKKGNSKKMIAAMPIACFEIDTSKPDFPNFEHTDKWWS